MLIGSKEAWPVIQIGSHFLALFRHIIFPHITGDDEIVVLRNLAGPVKPAVLRQPQGMECCPDGRPVMLRQLDKPGYISKKGLIVIIHMNRGSLSLGCLHPYKVFKILKKATYGSRKRKDCHGSLTPRRGNINRYCA